MDVIEFPKQNMLENTINRNSELVIQINATFPKLVKPMHETIRSYTLRESPST
jgi:hypothetical protein